MSKYPLPKILPMLTFDISFIAIINIKTGPVINNIERIFDIFSNIFLLLFLK